MASFKTLFLMQLKEKFDFSFIKSRKQMTLKVITTILGFVIITAFAYFVMWFCQYLNLFSAISYLPLSVMAVLFLVLFLFSLISCTISLCKELYKSRDNQVLLTYPVSPNMIFLSKMLVTLISEIKRTFYFMITVFIAYAILVKLPWYSYIWIPVMLLIFTAFTVSLAGLLALPANYIAWFFKKFNILRVIVVILLIAAVIGVLIYIITLIPSQINLIQSWSGVSETIRNFLDWFTNAFYFCYAFVSFLCGKYYSYSVTFFSEYTYWVLLAIIVGIAVFVALDVLISKYLYVRVVQRQFEFDRKVVKESKPNVKRGKFLSSFFYDGKRILGDSSLVSSLITVIILCPVIVLLLNIVFSGMSTRLVGQHMIVSFNILIVTLFAMTSNIWTASLYSRDGNALYLEKTKPNKAFNILFSRLVVSFISSILVILPSSIIFIYESDIGVLDGFLIILIEIFVVYGHLLWSAEIDFMNPKPNLFQTSGAAARNPNETKSMVLSFVISVATMLIVLLFLQITPKLEYLRVLPFAFIFVVYRLISFRLKSEKFLEGSS